MTIMTTYVQEDQTLYGEVQFVAKIKENSIVIPSSIEFNPNKLLVEKVEIKSHNSNEISLIVFLASIQSEDQGRDIAEKVTLEVLSHIAFLFSIAFEKPQFCGGHFFAEHSNFDVFSKSIVEPKLSPPDDAAHHVLLLTTEHVEQLKTQLEKASSLERLYFLMFRSALQPKSPVEKFLHLYSILLMLNNDDQESIDAFIVKEQPSVVKVPPVASWRKEEDETIYTCLRNSVIQYRKVVNNDSFIAEIENHLPRLIELTKKAIELNT